MQHNDFYQHYNDQSEFNLMIKKHFWKQPYAIRRKITK